ncbi:chromatin remodelling complex Rsc7/Swp82 subunit-domain-containing protein [Dichotomocladium elegans]|nr:chromatin remodelling complex Rsc7/Swp82 subunit-domain-containing protein [Dichotomocladium elegans]
MPAISRDPTGGRRRRGRPPRRRPFGRRTMTTTTTEDASTSNQESVEDGSDNNAYESESDPSPRTVRTSTRKRGRPPKRSATPGEDMQAETKRRKEGSPSQPSQERGQQDESYESDIDEAGEEKIDKAGRLLGGREYKVPTFTLPMRGDQVLMFAMEPARLLNYRDSYLFFHKNPHLERARLTEDERNWLVDQRLLVHWFRNRDVAVVSARSCFKCFGHKIIKKGKRVKDDYYEARAREEMEALLSATGAEELDVDGGEDSDGEPKIGRRTLISRTSRSLGYDTSVPVNNGTWMHHAALAVRNFNAQLHERRAEKAVFYDIHTNIHQIAAATQPTKCEFKCVDNTQDTFSVEDIQFRNSAESPVFRGVGRALLEDVGNENMLLDTLPENLRKAAKARLRSYKDSANSDQQQKDEDEKYPIALMDGQYQAAFPIHLTRFNQPDPKLAPPSALTASAQSIVAQQHYYSQMYQVMNQSIASYQDPNNPLSQPFPSAVQPRPLINHHQPPPHSSLHLNNAQQLSPQPIQHGAPPELFMCSAGSCRRPVTRPGERCQLHANERANISGTPTHRKSTPPAPRVAPTTIAQTPAATYADNKCSDCHYLSAPSELLSKDGKDSCDAFTMIKCAKCNRKYHPVCTHLTTARQIAAAESYPWVCPECKICCVCKTSGDESTLMICDDCDRGWHTGCCDPKVEKVPEGSWLCSLCADCHGCGEHGDKTEYKHAIAPPNDKCKYPVYLATYCPKCYDNFKHDRYCPVCLKPFSDEDDNDDEENEMVACDSCDHWIHTGCDETLTPEKYQSLCDDEGAKYTCPLCADQVKPLPANAGSSTPALKGQSAPNGFCVGIVGGKIRTRGIVQYNNHKIAVPEIKGAGISELPSQPSSTPSSTSK